MPEIIFFRIQYCSKIQNCRDKFWAKPIKVILENSLFYVSRQILTVLEILGILKWRKKKDRGGQDAAELQRHYDTVGQSCGFESPEEGVVPEVHQLQTEARKRRQRPGTNSFDFFGMLKLVVAI